MGRPFPSWRLGLEADINPDEVYRRFRVFLDKYLPMSQDELAKKLKRNRTTISKWKSANSSDWRAGLDQQKEVVEAVGRRLRRIQLHLGKVDQMIEALEALEQAQHAHDEKFGDQTLDGLREANERVRELLKPGGEKSLGLP